MLTKPTTPKLLNSIEELVMQDEIGYFIEIGARNENLGKDAPPGSTLKFEFVHTVHSSLVFCIIFSGYFTKVGNVILAHVLQMLL